MKKTMWVWTFALSLMLAIVGCGKKDGVDTGKLESSFASADATVKNAVDKAVAAIKAQNFPAALTELQATAAKAKLTPEQEQAIKDVVAQVQEALSKAAGKATEGAAKAADDLKKALPK